MSKNTPNQHTIPNMYLRNFGTPNGKDSNIYVYVYDLFNAKTFQASTNVIPREKRFYDEDPSSSLEGWLNTIESVSVGEYPLRKLVQKGVKSDLDFDERLRVSLLLGNLITRTKQERMYYELDFSAFEEGSKRFPGKDWSTFFSYIPNAVALHNTHIYTNTYRWGAILTYSHWGIVFPPLGRKFQVSDNPVIGFEDEQLLFIPISKDIAIAVVCDIDEDYYWIDPGYTLDHDELDFFNLQQLKQAYRFVFAETKEDFNIQDGVWDEDIETVPLDGEELIDNVLASMKATLKSP